MHNGGVPSVMRACSHVSACAIQWRGTFAPRRDFDCSPREKPQHLVLWGMQEGTPTPILSKTKRTIRFLPRAAGEGDHAQHGGGGERTTAPPPSRARYARARHLPRSAGEEPGFCRLLPQRGGGGPCKRSTWGTCSRSMVEGPSNFRRFEWELFGYQGGCETP